ncbi:MAG TPA: hypothetical protein PKC24_15990 [Cyclobacteriaceae bacterium]|nr:hypothetical protein [Cyclobacteriaceae bacterium]
MVAKETISLENNSWSLLKKFVFPLETHDSVHITFSSELASDSVFVSAKRKPLEIKDFRLNRSKINVITEVPYIY